MTNKEIIEHCNDYGYSDEESGAFKDGYNKAYEELEIKYQELIYKAETNIYNKAIDDFVEAIKNSPNLYYGIRTQEINMYSIKDISKKLKVGGNNDD